VCIYHLHYSRVSHLCVLLVEVADVFPLLTAAVCMLAVGYYLSSVAYSTVQHRKMIEQTAVASAAVAALAVAAVVVQQSIGINGTSIAVRTSLTQCAAAVVESVQQALCKTLFTQHISMSHVQHSMPCIQRQSVTIEAASDWWQTLLCFFKCCNALLHLQQCSIPLIY
jgi:hypothetical protein